VLFGEVDKLNKLLYAKDQQLVDVSLRLQQTTSQMLRPSISAGDAVYEENAKLRAQLERKIHEIEELQKRGAQLEITLSKSGDVANRLLDCEAKLTLLREENQKLRDVLLKNRSEGEKRSGALNERDTERLLEENRNLNEIMRARVSEIDGLKNKKSKIIQRNLLNLFFYFN
jgi:hypothetical protein